MKRNSFLAQVLALAIMTSIVQAADKADPTGTWKWKARANETKLEMTLKLTLTEKKLTGTIEGSKASKKEIENATCEDGEISFSVKRAQKDGDVTTKYKGKLDGDTIKGSAEVTRPDGKTTKRDWSAQRDK